MNCFRVVRPSKCAMRFTSVSHTPSMLRNVFTNCQACSRFFARKKRTRSKSLLWNVCPVISGMASSVGLMVKMCLYTVRSLVGATSIFAMKKSRSSGSEGVVSVLSCSGSVMKLKGERSLNS